MLSVNEIIAITKDSVPPDLVFLCKAMKAQLNYENLCNDEIGHIKPRDEKTHWQIVVNSDMSVSVQRFAIVSLVLYIATLPHVVRNGLSIGEAGQLDSALPFYNPFVTNTDRYTVIHHARDILLPEGTVRNLYAEYCGDIGAISEKMLISEKAVEFRLSELEKNSLNVSVI